MKVASFLAEVQQYQVADPTLRPALELYPFLHHLVGEVPSEGLLSIPFISPLVMSLGSWF